MHDLDHSTNVTVAMVAINDKQHMLYLNGTYRDSNVTFIEEGPAIYLSYNLSIADEDVGLKEFTNATVTILQGRIPVD